MLQETAKASAKVAAMNDNDLYVVFSLISVTLTYLANIAIFHIILIFADITYACARMECAFVRYIPVFGCVGRGRFRLMAIAEVNSYNIYI